MQQPLPNKVSSQAGPRFYISERQPLRPGAILVAIVAAAAALFAVVYALSHNGKVHLGAEDDQVSRSSSTASGAAPADDDNDDPSQIDTIVLADPADAPVPARKGDHVSPVHPTILVHLPRYGDKVGLIPDSPAGHLLYDWLAAFNQPNEAGLAKALPTAAPASVLEAQLELRQQTGGLSLISAKEIQPGLLVFRMHDQTPQQTEVLGTLQVRANSNPAEIASFSLRAVTTLHKDAVSGPVSEQPEPQR